MIFNIILIYFYYSDGHKLSKLAYNKNHKAIYRENIFDGEIPLYIWLKNGGEL